MHIVAYSLPTTAVMLHSKMTGMCYLVKHNNTIKVVQCKKIMVLRSDGVLETGVSARGSLETGFWMSRLGLETFCKCLGLGSVSGPPCLGLGSVSGPWCLGLGSVSGPWCLGLGSVSRKMSRSREKSLGLEENVSTSSLCYKMYHIFLLTVKEHLTFNSIMYFTCLTSHVF